MSVLDKILEAGRKRGLNQSAIERSAGLAEDRISKWRGGKGEPGWSQVIRMADVVGIADLNYLRDEAVGEYEGESASEDALMVKRLVKKLGPEEALRRLIQADVPLFSQHEPGKRPRNAGGSQK